MVSAVTPVTSTGQAAQTAAKKGNLDKTDFLKLLVAQLSQQDPLNPMDNTAFVAQLAQFSSLELLQNMSTSMGSLSDSINSSNAYTSLGLLGKTVMAKSDSVAWSGTAPVELGFGLDSSITDANARIYDGSGKLIRTIPLGKLDRGMHTQAWDGKNDLGAAATPGNYYVEVSGTDSAGNAVTATNYLSGKVSGVTFQNGVPYLSIGSVLFPIANVVQVEVAENQAVSAP